MSVASPDGWTGCPALLNGLPIISRKSPRAMSYGPAGAAGTVSALPRL
jgi:hypothetical protein